MREQAPRLLILLAERDPYAAEFAEFFLQTEGYEVALALDADDAALKLEQRLPQLAVIELLISGGTGADLCQRLKEAGVPACLVISTLDARDQALAAGADAFLRKPLDPLQFVSTVKDLLGKSAFLQGRDVAMSERLLSGHPRLDGVLGGGLPVDAINMLIGLPGTGKTILAQQYLFANATHRAARPVPRRRCRSRSKRSSATARASASSTLERSATRSSTRTSARRSTSAVSPASSSR